MNESRKSVHENEHLVGIFQKADDSEHVGLVGTYVEQSVLSQHRMSENERLVRSRIAYRVASYGVKLIKLSAKIAPWQVTVD